MLIDKNTARKIKVKRALNSIGIKKLAKELNTTYATLKKVENGDYDVNRRIFNEIMNWLNDYEETKNSNDIY